VRDVGDGVPDRHLGGQRLARDLRPHGLARDDEDRLEPVGRVEPHRLPVRAHHEAAQQRGGHVVRVTLELGRVREQVGVEFEQVVRSDEARNVGGRAGPQAAAERDAGADAEREAVGRVQALEPAHGEVAAIARDRELGLDGERPRRLAHLQLHVQRERGGENVEARSEVGRRRGNADEPATLHQGKIARSTAASSTSHGTTDPACSSAVCGSLRP
jgi:hypothetical protein